MILTSGEDRIFPKDLLIGNVYPWRTGESISNNSRSARGAARSAGRCIDSAHAARTEEAQRISRRERLGFERPRYRSKGNRSGSRGTQTVCGISLNANSDAARSEELKMSYMLNSAAHSESNVEVHKYYGGTVLVAAFLALVLQAFLHKYGRWSELVDLALAGDHLFRCEPAKSGHRNVPGRRDRHPAGRAQPRQSHRPIRHRENNHGLSGVNGWREDRHAASRQPLSSDIYFLSSASGDLRSHGARPAESPRAILHAAPAAEFGGHRGLRRRSSSRSSIASAGPDSIGEFPAKISVRPEKRQDD